MRLGPSSIASLTFRIVADSGGGGQGRVGLGPAEGEASMHGRRQKTKDRRRKTQDGA